jgi:hypothetical protein
MLSMRTIEAALVAIVLACIAPSLAAAESRFPDDYTRLLLPIVATSVHGANGSLWTTEWTVYNGNAAQLAIEGPLPFLALSPVVPDAGVPPHRTRRIVLEQPMAGFDGAFVYVPTALLARAPMSLRVRDTSVNAQSYGASLPVVRPSAFDTKIVLVDVPADAAYRTMLRIYGDSPDVQVVHVAVFNPEGDKLLDERDLVLQMNQAFGLTGFPRPAYAQLDAISPAVRNAAQPVRIEITSADRIWAFVSISQNETQQVTVVTPN